MTAQSDPYLTTPCLLTAFLPTPGLHRTLSRWTPCLR